MNQQFNQQSNKQTNQSSNQLSDQQWDENGIHDMKFDFLHADISDDSIFKIPRGF